MIRFGLILPLVVVTGLGSTTDGIGQALQVGGHVGAVVSRLGGDGDYGTGMGLSAGIFAGIELSRTIGLYPELAYVPKGASAENFVHGFDPSTGNLVELRLTHTVNLHYLELYLPVAWQLPLDGRSVRPRLYAGPSLAFELACEADLKLRSETISPTGETLDVTEVEVASGGCGQEIEGRPGVPLFDETARLDPGLLFGVGVEIALGSGAISGEVRYDLGLKDITTGESGSQRNRAFHFLVGYSRHLRSN